MSMITQPSAFFFAPFVSSVMRIDPGWIDYNGHLNMAYYNVLFDRALDEAFAVLGLGVDYVNERHCSSFTVECHVTYKRELSLADPVRVTVQLLDFDEKRMHFYQELRHATEFWLSATSETMHIHMDMQERKVAPFPPDILAGIAIMKAAHSQLPRADAIGRVMKIPEKAVRPGVH